MLIKFNLNHNNSLILIITIRSQDISFYILSAHFSFLLIFFFLEM